MLAHALTQSIKQTQAKRELLTMVLDVSALEAIVQLTWL